MPQKAYSVYFDKRVEKFLKNTDDLVLKQILQVVLELENFSKNSRNIKKLRTPFDSYRKRFRDYRILFKVDKNKIFVYAIKHRKDAYK